MCQYFKYMRFFQDGLVLYFNSNKKLGVRLVDRVLSRDFWAFSKGEIELGELSRRLGILEGEGSWASKMRNKLLSGEYLVKKSKVHIRLLQRTNVFSFTFDIRPDHEGRPNRILFQKKFKIQDL